MKRMLIVEDDQSILRGLREAFAAEHFDIEAEADGLKGLSAARRKKYDVIMLDIMLPTMNGTEICRSLRAEGVQTPIVMLTSKGSETDKVTGLELGADDYVTKPFSIKELIARVHAVLRRQQAVVSELQECNVGDVHVDFVRQEARKGKTAIEMTSKEYQLLKYVVEREGQVITRAQLLDDVWGYEATPTTRTVDNYILSLRKKLESDPSNPRHLITIHTAGYKYAGDAARPAKPSRRKKRP